MLYHQTGTWQKMLVSFNELVRVNDWGYCGSVDAMHAAAKKNRRVDAAVYDAVSERDGAAVGNLVDTQGAVGPLNTVIVLYDELKISPRVAAASN